MCHQYLTLYDFCRCQEDAGNTLCAGQQGHDCAGVDTQTVRMYCFCNWHASKSWTSELRAQMKHKKQQKRQKRRSAPVPLSEKPLVPKGWFSWSSLRSRNSFS